MFVFAPCFPRALLLSALLWISAAFPSSEECKPNSLPDMKINIGLAVAKGVKFTDPINAANEEECVTACCMEQNRDGRDCNLVVYDTRESSTLQNCYMFLCPEPEACPMIPAPGVLSYSLWTENPSLEKNDPDLDDGHLKTSKSKVSGKVQSKKPALTIHSAFPVESDSEEEPKQKSSIKKPPPVHPLSKADEVKNPASEDGEDQPKMGQSPSGKKPDPNIDSYPSESLEEPSHHDLVEQSSLSKFHPQSRTTELKLPTNQDYDTPDHITSKLLNLAEKIDKQLGKIAAKSEQGRGSDESSVDISDLPMSPESDGVPPMKLQPKDYKKLPLGTKKSKPSEVVEDNSESLEIDYPTLDHQTTTSDRTTYKVTTTVPNTLPHIKHSFTTFKGSKVPIKVPSSEIKNTKIASSHHSANASNTATVVKNVQTGHHTTTEQSPTSRTTHQTKNVQPMTHHDFALPLSSKGANSTLKISSKDMKKSDQSVLKPDPLEQKDTSAPAVDLKEVPQNIDAQGTSQNYSDKSGLVAALIFGVVFLAVVIFLVTRKVSEARRRHQYTKLDYLINGMYVDT